MYLNPVLDREAWVEARRLGIGGSDASVLVGWNPYTTLRELWNDKKGEGQEFVTNRFVEWGNLLEPVVLQKYAYDMDAKVLGRDLHGRPVVFHPSPSQHPDTEVRENYIATLDSLQSPLAPMRANVDGYLLGDDGRLVRGLEVKTTTAWRTKDWDERFPAHYVCQVAHNQRVLKHLGYEVPFSFLVLIGGNKFGIIDLPLDQYEWLADEIEERAHKFWACVERDVPPQSKDFPRLLLEDDYVGTRVSEPKGGIRILPPTGAVQAVMVDEVDRGFHDQTWPGQPKRRVAKVSLHFLLKTKIPDGMWTHPGTGEVIEVPEKLAGRHYGVSRWFTQSLHEKAALRAFVRDMMARNLTKTELKEFDLESLIGTNVILNLSHKGEGSEMKTVITGVTPLLEGMETMPIPSDYVRIQDRKDFDGNDDDDDGDERLPF